MFHKAKLAVIFSRKEAGNQTRAIQHIDWAIWATETNDERLRVNIEEAIKAVKEIQDGYVRSLWTGIIIIIFSSGALLGILYKLRKRGGDLEDNVRMVFNYLLVRESYNIARRTIGFGGELGSGKAETFDKSLQAVEQYLASGDWTLIGITVDQIQLDYQEMFVETVRGKVVVTRSIDDRPVETG